MAGMAASSLKRRISRLQLRSEAFDFRSGPSAALLDLLAQLNAMTKSQIAEVKARGVGVL